MTWSITMADMRRDGFEEGLTTGVEQGREQGREQGAYETKLETAKAFLAMGLSPEQVAQGTNLPLETVFELAQQLGGST